MMDMIEDNDVSFLSDEDRDKEDLLNKQVQIKLLQKQIDAQDNLKTRHEGLVTEVGGVTWSNVTFKRKICRMMTIKKMQ